VSAAKAVIILVHCDTGNILQAPFSVQQNF